MPDQVRTDIVGERYDRLHLHQQSISLSVNQEAIGKNFKVLVGDYEGRRDIAQERLTGRSKDFRLVHFDNTAKARPGDEVDVVITKASAHYLIGTPGAIRATRGGDAHEARNTQVKRAPTLLGMPTVPR